MRTHKSSNDMAKITGGRRIIPHQKTLPGIRANDCKKMIDRRSVVHSYPREASPGEVLSSFTAATLSSAARSLRMTFPIAASTTCRVWYERCCPARSCVRARVCVCVREWEYYEGATQRGTACVRETRHSEKDRAVVRVFEPCTLNNTGV